MAQFANAACLFHLGNVVWSQEVCITIAGLHFLFPSGCASAFCRIDFGDQNWDFFKFFGRFGTFPRPFDLSTEGVALSHQGACIREVRIFCHWASCRDPNLLNWDLGRTSPWTPMESTDPLNSGGCDSSRLGCPNGPSCKLPPLSGFFGFRVLSGLGDLRPSWRTA